MSKRDVTLVCVCVFVRVWKRERDSDKSSPTHSPTLKTTHIHTNHLINNGSPVFCQGLTTHCTSPSPFPCLPHHVDPDNPPHSPTNPHQQHQDQGRTLTAAAANAWAWKTKTGRHCFNGTESELKGRKENGPHMVTDWGTGINKYWIDLGLNYCSFCTEVLWAVGSESSTDKDDGKLWQMFSWYDLAVAIYCVRSW